MIPHDLPGAAAFGTLEGAPAVNQINILRGDASSPRFGGSPAAEGATNAVGVMDADTGRDERGLEGLDVLDAVQQIQFQIRRRQKPTVSVTEGRAMKMVVMGPQSN